MRALSRSLVALASTQAEGRARDLGVPFEGKPGPLNAITDVPGVEVGQKTLIDGEGPLKVGKGPVRSGVTVIFPRGRNNLRPVYGGYFNLNGNGEMTGRAYLRRFRRRQRADRHHRAPTPSARSMPASSNGP